MRARLLLTGIALGATVLMGGAATAQAAPATSQTSTTSTVAGSWVRIGTFSESRCYAEAASYAGPAYCTPVGGGRFALYVWVE